MNNLRIGEIDRLMRDNRYAEAILICDELIAEDVDCYLGYSKRSYLYHDMGNFAAAIADLAHLMRLRPPDLAAYMRRAQIHLGLGEDRLALQDIEFVIASNEYYFLDTARCYKIIALLNLGEKAAAKLALSKLPHGFRYHVVTPRLGSSVITREVLYDMTKD